MDKNSPKLSPAVASRSRAGIRGNTTISTYLDRAATISTYLARWMRAPFVEFWDVRVSFVGMHLLSQL
jgi:hypothetical protein